jgi:hypothetical protein
VFAATCVRLDIASPRRDGPFLTTYYLPVTYHSKNSTLLRAAPDEAIQSVPQKDLPLRSHTPTCARFSC